MCVLEVCLNRFFGRTVRKYLAGLYVKGQSKSGSVGEVYIALMMLYVEQSVFWENSKGVFGRLVCERVAEKNDSFGES